MSGTRTDAVYRFEKEFGELEEPEGYKIWRYLGPGLSNFSYTPTNNINYTYALGSKFWDIATVGRFSGTWSADLLLDYNHFEYFLLAFEGYSYDTDTKVHHFYKSDDDRLKSFEIKVQKRNLIVNGSKDEYIHLKGCIVNSFGLAYESSSGSAVKVTLRGLYANEVSEYSTTKIAKFRDDATIDNNPNAENAGYETFPVEWGCLCTEETTGTTTTYTPIANTEKASFTMSHQVKTIPNCGSRIDGDFYESQAQAFQLQTTVYSRKPELWYQKMYSGGFDSSKTTPMNKGLKPIDHLDVISRGDENKYSEELPTQDYVRCRFNKVYVKSVPRTLNTGSELVDTPSLDVRNMDVYIKSQKIVKKIDPTQKVYEAPAQATE